MKLLSKKKLNNIIADAHLRGYSAGMNKGYIVGWEAHRNGDSKRYKQIKAEYDEFERKIQEAHDGQNNNRARR